jgi:hypothetical protein
MSPDAKPRLGLTSAFREARQVLGLGADTDAVAVKRAWRRAAANHPPDRDPEAFRKAREAFELLSDPLKHAQKMIWQPIASAPMPDVPDLPPFPPAHALAVELLRSILGRLPIEDLRPARGAARTSAPPEERT